MNTDEPRGVPDSFEMWFMFWGWVIGFLAIIFGIKYMFMFMFWMFITVLKFLVWLGL